MALRMTPARSRAAMARQHPGPAHCWHLPSLWDGDGRFPVRWVCCWCGVHTDKPTASHPAHGPHALEDTP